MTGGVKLSVSSRLFNPNLDFSCNIAADITCQVLGVIHTDFINESSLHTKIYVNVIYNVIPDQSRNISSIISFMEATCAEKIAWGEVICDTHPPRAILGESRFVSAVIVHTHVSMCTCTCLCINPII